MSPYRKLEKTKNPPGHKPILIWDGTCEFCQYWVYHWANWTSSFVDYAPYQIVSEDFSDIDTHSFKQAVRLIDVDGSIYSGAEAAFKAFQLGQVATWPYKLYRKWALFRDLTEFIYDRVAKNRPMMFKVTKFFLGKDPSKVRPFGLILVVMLLGILIYLLSKRD